MKTLIRSLCLSLVLILPATASELGGFLWLMDASGTGVVGDTGILGTTFDLENDLGVEQEIETPGFTVILGDVLQLGVSGYQFNADGESTITRDIRFRDLNFRASSDVSSEVDLTVGQAFLRLSSPTPGFKVGGEVGLIYADVEATASATGVGKSSGSAAGAVPTFGAVARFQPVDFFSVNGLLRYADWKIDDVNVEYLEWEVSGRLNAGPIFVGGGYRQVELVAADKSENVGVDLEFSGPVVFLGAEF